MPYGTQQSLDIPGLLAGADLSDSQFLAVKLASTAGEVVVVNATTDVAIGILQNAPEDTEPAEIRILGVSKMKMAVTVDQGDVLGWNTTGQGTSRANGGSRAFGHAVETSVDAGDISTVLLTGFWRR